MNKGKRKVNFNLTGNSSDDDSDLYAWGSRQRVDIDLTKNSNAFDNQLHAEITSVERSTGLTRSAAIAYLLSRPTEGTSRRTNTLSRWLQTSRAANARRAGRAAARKTFDTPLVADRIASHIKDPANLARFASVSRTTRAEAYKYQNNRPCIVGGDALRQKRLTQSAWFEEGRARGEKRRRKDFPRLAYDTAGWYVSAIPGRYLGAYATKEALVKLLRRVERAPQQLLRVDLRGQLKRVVNGLLLLCGPSRVAYELRKLLESAATGPAVMLRTPALFVDEARQLSFWSLYIVLALLRAFAL